MGIGLLAHGRYVSDEIIGNDRFAGKSFLRCLGEDESGEPIFDCEKVFLDEEKILKTTGGIRERRDVSQGMNCVDYIERAFSQTGFSPEDLQGIIVGTISQERRFPSVACEVQERIGAKSAREVFDVSAACSGFLHSLHLGNRLSMFERKPYLVAGVELLPRYVDYHEINCDLFGAGCGVAVIGPTDSNGSKIINTLLDSDSSGLRAIYADKYDLLRMPAGKKGEGGQDVMKKATQGMIHIAHEVLDRSMYSVDDVKLIIPHQANGRIIERVRRKVDPDDTGKVYQNIERYGNMSSATVAYGLSEAIDEGRASKGDLVLLLAMGAGYAKGGALLRV